MIDVRLSAAHSAYSIASAAAAPARSSTHAHAARAADPAADPGRAPAVPEGVRVYAVGDIHGQLGQLRALHAMIAADAAAAPEPERVIVYLGDYVDRGPDTRGVIEHLLEPPPVAATTVHLCGNHEEMMLDVMFAPMGPPGGGVRWLVNGGEATLESYRLSPLMRPSAWGAALPDAHAAFLRGLRHQHRVGDYLFVHAGIRPGVALGAQEPHDMMWIREPFLSSTAWHGAVVVHGHTPAPEPQLRANRIGLDTGAAFGGPLTCLVLWGEERAILQAPPGG
ncbi:MAG: serine/threonine protein phosphatase [Alphaproteobacteria bacterium]|nr:serine/threonine protein phosphatase [Alphaproteobacteria bacterium]